MQEFEIPPDELKRLRDEGEARVREEEARLHARTADPAQPPASAVGESSPAPSESRSPSKPHGDNANAGRRLEQAAPGAGFWPRLDPSTPVSEFFQATFVRLMLAFWLPSVILTLVMVTGLWSGPPEVKYPYGGQTWSSKEEEQAAVQAYQRRKAFDAIWSAALAGSLAPLLVGLALYVVLTEKDNPWKGVSMRIKFGYSLLAITGVAQIAVAPALILINVWRYFSM